MIILVSGQQYGQHFQQKKSMDQPGKVANSARGQLNRKHAFSLSPFAPENLISRDRFVPSHVSPLILHRQCGTQA